MPETESPMPEGSVASRDDAALVAALRAGDEAAFAQLVERYGGLMLRVARLYVPTRAVAEEVVQETWLGAFRGIGGFEARASLKTWLFRILTNTAQSRAAREGRSLPFSALAQRELAADEIAVDPDLFIPQGERWAGHWVSSPRRFEDLPESRLISAETVAAAKQAIDELPDVQRAVITMRDVAGFSSEEVCDTLGLSPGNQRVLLHRARSKVRVALEQHLEEGAA